MSNISSDGASLPLVKVVEYLETSMSRELLCKFPDNSAFDFDYAQSSIWSPLLPRAATPDAIAQDLEISRKLSYDETDDVGLLENTRKMAASIKRKFTNVVLDNVGMCRRMKRRRRKSFGFSPVATSSHRLPSSSTSPKAWAKVIKAASKHFKKTKNKKKDANVHLDLSNYLKGGDF